MGQRCFLVFRLALILLFTATTDLSFQLQAQDQSATDAQSAAQTQPGSEEEIWFGVLDAEVRRFRFTIRLKESNEGWSGVLKSLDEGGREFGLDNVRRDDSSLAFEIKATNAKYSATLGEGGEVAKGRWLQNGADLELELKQVQEPPAQKLTAVWTGELNALVQKLKVQVRELESGEVYFDSLTQQAGGFVAKKTVDGDQVIIEVPAVRGKFEGTLEADGQRLVGKWRQGLIPLQLTLERSEQTVSEEESQPKRPQTPQPPFPYEVQEVTFENEQAEVKLVGTLTIPDRETSPEEQKTKFPAVILISGSGPQDRDESILGHKPFWVIADHFSKKGIAVLRYDERGVGQSSGTFEDANSTDFAADVRAAIAFLAAHPAIDASQIGLCGHSEGGLIASMVAAQDERVAFIVLMAGPGVNGQKVVESQTRLILEVSGVPAEEIERQMKIQRAFIELAKQDPLPTKEEFSQAAMEKAGDYFTANEMEEDTARQMIDAAFQQLVSPWFQFFMSHEPASDLEKIACPVLAINGEKDLQVDPKLNLPAIEAALEKAPTDDFTLRELKGLNHLFQQSKTGLVQEYAQLEETFNPAALQLMTEWILEKTDRKQP
jgi:pimeloyl-ACP methyl ester carboxylesterase